MRLRYRRRRDALVDAIAGFNVGISGLSAGVNMLLTLPDGTEHEVMQRAGEAGIALNGLSMMRHPHAGPDIPGARRDHRRFRRPRRACLRSGGRCIVRRTGSSGLARK